MKKMLFIVNPAAGQRKVVRCLPELIAMFNRGGCEPAVYMTAGPQDATRITEDRAADFDTVVCAGGDGTLNEVITGVLRSGASVPIGYIPAGSTNDFAATLGLPTNIPEAARLILSGTPAAYDVGRFADRYFSYVASFGAFTRVSYSTPQNVKNTFGRLAYFLDGVQELTQLRELSARVELEDEVILGDDFIFGAVTNTTSIGGVLTLDTSRVDLRDGKLELLLLRCPRTMADLGVMIRALGTGCYELSDSIIFRSVSSVTFRMDPQIPWTLDGEAAQGSAVIHISNLHRAVELITEVPHD